MTKHLLWYHHCYSIFFYSKKKKKGRQYEIQGKNKWRSANEKRQTATKICNAWTFGQYTYGLLGILALCFILFFFIFSSLLWLSCVSNISMASGFRSEHLDNYIIAVTIFRTWILCVCVCVRICWNNGFSSVQICSIQLRNAHSEFEFMSFSLIEIKSNKEYSNWRCFAD